LDCWLISGYAVQDHKHRPVANGALSKTLGTLGGVL
jgi:hypothetical protein